MNGEPPLKWKKYLLLVKYDLLTMEELERDIRRYPFSHKHELLEDLKKELATGAGNLYVVKLVPPQQQGQLPNLRITEERELNVFGEFLEKHRQLGPTEVWYCKTRIHGEVFSVAGRISIDPGSSPKSHVVEQIWRGSPRLIESFGKNFTHAYARASRCAWGWHYSIEEIFSPEGLPRSQQESEFRRSLALIERKRNAIELFLSELETRGQTSVSLEYKIISSTLSIIDWDTANDKKVIDDELRILR